MARSPPYEDIPVLACIVSVVVGVCLGTYFLHGYRYPIGPDAPANIWWTRLAGHDGLSVAGGRAGAPALVLIVSSALGQSPAVVVTALEALLASAAGLAAAAFVAGLRGPLGGRAAQLLAGLLTGIVRGRLDALAPGNRSSRELDRPVVGGLWLESARGGQAVARSAGSGFDARWMRARHIRVG